MNKEEIKKKLLVSFAEEFLSDIESMYRSLTAMKEAKSTADWIDSLGSLEASCHKLRGASRTAGVNPVRLILAELGKLSKLLIKIESAPPGFSIDVLRECLDTARTIVQRISKGQPYPEDLHEPIVAKLSAEFVRLNKDDIGTTDHENLRGKEGKREDSSPTASRDKATLERPKARVSSHSDQSFSITGGDRIFKVFIAEVEDSVDSMNKRLVAMDNDDQSWEIHRSGLDSIYRTAHTIKGASRGLGFIPYVKIFHELEESLVNQRQRNAIVSKADIHAMFSIVRDIGEIKNQLAQGAEVSISSIRSPLEKIGGLFGEHGAEEDDLSEKSLRGEEIVEEPESEFIEASEFPDLAATGTDLPDQFPKEEASLDSYLSQSSFVRVDAKRLDSLLGQSSELKLAFRRFLKWEKSIGEISGRIKALNRKSANDAARLAIIEDLGSNLEGTMGSLGQHSRRLHRLLSSLDSEVRNVRLQPFDEACLALNGVIHDFMDQDDKEISLSIIGGELDVDRSVIEGLKAPLLHLVRNAMDHGIESREERKNQGKPVRGNIAIEAKTQGHDLIVTVRDDGKGIRRSTIRQRAREKGIDIPDDDEGILNLIFRPGFSTATMITDISGRGVGMDVVRDAVHALHGGIKVESQPGSGTSIIMTMPLTLTSISGLLVETGGQPYAITTTNVKRALKVKPQEVKVFEGKGAIEIEGRPIPLLSLAEALGLPKSDSKADPEALDVVLIKSGDTQVGVMVDRIINDEEILIKAMPKRLQGLAHSSSATILTSGRPALIINPSFLISKMTTGVELGQLESLKQSRGRAKKKKILLAEDSATTRTLEKSVLEGAGYDVVDVGDGAEAWQVLQQGGIDLVVTDVEMPRMDGFKFTELIRESHRFKEMPVVLVTGLSRDEDKKEGLRVGASAYIVKGDFDDQNLIRVIGQLI